MAVSMLGLNRLLFIGYLGTSLLFTAPALAQLSKAEKKIWKKELRNLTPEAVKSLRDENESLSSQLNTANQESDRLKSTAFNQELEIKSLKSQLDEVNEQLKFREVQLRLVNEEGTRWDTGVVFKVQIAAIKEREHKRKIEKNHHLEVEDQDGLHRYVLGNFRDYEDANFLKKRMRKVGINSAWIVPYKDGKRVPLKEVLDVVIGE
jgi:septal ring factor EnvC (AmiA/AmiB activator)